MSRLLILQDYLRHGGTESHSVWLASALRAAGVEAEILTFRPGGPLAKRAADAGVPLASLQKRDRGLDWFSPGLVKAVQARKPDAVLLMGKMANARAGALRKALPKVRIVGSVRTGHKLPWLVRRALCVCDAIVCNSTTVAATLPGPGLPAKKVTVVLNPPVLIPGAADPEARARVRAAQRESESDRVMLCVAGFRKGKGQDALIRALSHAPAFSRLVLWFVGDGETRAKCEALAAELDLGHRVRFFGHVPDPREIYLAADFAVMASDAESLPNFLVEAQLHGLPVVAVDVGGVKETFLPGESGVLVPAGDEPALLAACLGFAEDSARLAAFSRRAREWAPTVFSEAAALAAYRRVFGF